MHLLLDIKEEKADFFLTLLNDYKKYVKATVLSREKKEIISDVKEAAHQMTLIKQGKLKTRSLKEFIDEL